MNSHLPRACFALLILAALAASALVATSCAEDANLVAALKAKGAEVTETQGEITGVAFKTKVVLGQGRPGSDSAIDAREDLRLRGGV